MTADAPQASMGGVDRAQQPSAGVSGLFQLPGFGGLMVANVLAAVGFGTSRFVFVWLVGELTDWNPATAIVGIAIGLPPLFLSAWAGSLVDRLDPQRFGVAMFVISAAGFGLTALLITGDLMTVQLAMILGFLTAIAPSMIMPLLQALVPALVPSGRLMQGVAIQNLSMTVSTIAGVFLDGAVIQVFGVAAGFWLVTIAGGLGALVFARTRLPEQSEPADRRGAIRHGARIALGTEPLRSLLAITTVLGLAIATSTLLIPEFARDASMLLATRWTPSRPGLLLTIFSVTTIGGGLVAIGASRVYVVTALCSFGWGLCGGVVMTTLRTLTQVNTPPELMGRVMGLATMAQHGSFPLGALLLVGLVSATSVSAAMMIAGLICAAASALIALRPHVRSL